MYILLYLASSCSTTMVNPHQLCPLSLFGSWSLSPCSYGATQESSDNRPQATHSIIHESFGTLTYKHKEVNDKTHHLQEAKARSYCKLLPHLASTLHFRGPQHEHQKMLISTSHALISPWSISVKIKLGSWVQPTALDHSGLKLSVGLEQLYVCQPKLDMQRIEVRAYPPKFGKCLSKNI